MVTLAPVVAIGVADLSASALGWLGGGRLARLLPRKSSALDGIVRLVSLPCCHHVGMRSVGVAMQRGMVLRVTSTPDACASFRLSLGVGRELQNVQRV